MSDPQLHRTQVSILHSLRYAKSERFNALMRPTSHTSDTFKFHIQKLIKLGYVAKLADGTYQLTLKGKEFANSLNEAERTVQKQPKISVLMVIPKPGKDGQVQYLLQKRSRNPYFGYWGSVHGRAVWGEAFEETAAKQLKRQTGLSADITVGTFRRVRDFAADGKQLLEDKLFVVAVASNITGELSNNYDGGTNDWLTLAELRAEEKVFDTTMGVVEHYGSDQPYQTQDLLYDEGDY
jgi:ADP-ribose pyrophosphatase YjhB (NUDIX family)/predicted transcriptional regulator